MEIVCYFLSIVPVASLNKGLIESSGYYNYAMSDSNVSFKFLISRVHALLSLIREN